jgi:hypothetical protein
MVPMLAADVHSKDMFLIKKNLLCIGWLLVADISRRGLSVDRYTAPMARIPARSIWGSPINRKRRRPANEIAKGYKAPP